MSKILEALNDTQRAPAMATEGPVIVTAGAGSGKTRLLTHRIAHLVKDHGVDPYNILAITFTNKATAEMKDRLHSMVGGADSLWVSTFHAMCSKILRMHIERLGFDKKFTIYGDAEKTRVIKRLLTIDPNNEVKASDINSIAWHISNAKNKLLSPEEYKREIMFDKKSDHICQTYSNYQKELKLSNALDFDDLIFKTYELFLHNEDLLEKYSNRFRYIHVDEFQDTNYAQYQIVKMLASRHKNIFVVGDEDQCIYTWRGANCGNIDSFKKDFEGTKLFKLEQNYRSQKQILDKANQIIKYNSSRTEKNLWTDKPGGEEVSYHNLYNDLEEAEWIAQKIKMLTLEGYQYKDICVLMRLNSFSRVIEEKFLNYQIPHQVYGGFKFFERKEVKDVLAYLKVVSNPRDNDSMVRVMTYPKKGIGDVTINKVLAKAQELNLSVYEVLKSGYDLESSILKKTQPVIRMIDEFIEDSKTLSMSDLTEKLIKDNNLKLPGTRLSEEEVSKNLNIDSLLDSVFDFETKNPDSTLDDFLQSITLSRDIDDLDDAENYVSVMTIHSAKGLEFKVVFVIGLCEGWFPLSRSISGGKDELEEERRLMYVATTRAEELLFYTRPLEKFSFEKKRLEATMPSRFLKEAGFEDTLRIQSDRYSNNQVKSGVLRFDDDQDIEIDKPKVSRETLDNYSRFKRGSKVSHPSFGAGEVVVEVTDPIGAFITIRFETVGIKTLSLKFAPLTLL